MEPQISNEDLLSKLRESHLEDRHKKALEPLIPKMADENRQELVGLIDGSHDVKNQEVKARGDLKNLNEEFDKKMDNLYKELIENARKESEIEEKAESEKELAELESEIKNI